MNIDTSFNIFETLFKHAKENTILIMDETGAIISINKAFTNCFGYEPEDLIGQNIAILFTKTDQARGLPEQEISNVLSTGQCSDNNYLVKKDQTIIWVSGESILVKNENGQKIILKIIQNINLQKISESSLNKLNNFNDSILRSIEDIVLVLDYNFTVVTANKAFFTLFTETETNITSPDVNFEFLIRPFDKKGDLIDKIKRTLVNKRSFVYHPIEVEIPRSDNKIFNVSCSLMEHAEEANNLLIVLHDITAQKQAEREREDIIGFVAHELRNPLANIILSTEIMGIAIREHKLEDAEGMLSRTRNNVMRLNKMIGELYDATRINSGNLVLEITTFNVGEMVKEAVETIEILQPSYNIIVKGDSNLVINGDRHRLIQVITNYLSNGIKYSNGKTNVVLSISHDRYNLIISVKDEGLGISKEHLPYIFDRFFRAEKTRNLEGIGLGLYLCRQIITQHNGKVWADSEEGKGSEFFFSIPLAS